MSLFNTFDPSSEEFIKPKFQRSFSSATNFPEIFIVTFMEETFNILGKVYKTEIITNIREGRNIPIYQVSWSDKKIGIFHSIVGGAGTVCLLEQVIARGAKKILLYGGCGTLNKDITAGHLIVPTAAYRDEGTSYHYLPISDYVDIPTYLRTAEILRELQLPYVTGKVWTTDGFYRETKNNTEKRKADNCIAVDMECASVMAMGQFRNVPIYQFLYAEDCLDGTAWDPRILGFISDDIHENYLRVALEVASKI